MERECITEAQTVEEAVDAALEQLGVQQDAVEYEVLEEPSRGGMFGLGSEKPARVKVWVKAEYLAELEQAREVAAEIIGAGEDDQDEEEVLPPELAADDTPELTDEELDKVADTAVNVVKEILTKLGIEGATVEEYEGDEGEIILDVVGTELGLLIGRHGKTLDALQAAVGAVTTRQLGFRYPVVVDVEGYRHRRRQKLEEMARRAADRASRHHQPVHMRPMTAYERRVIHVALRNDRRVRTESEGAEPYRQVVVIPK